MIPRAGFGKHFVPPTTSATSSAPPKATEHTLPNTTASAFTAVPAVNVLHKAPTDWVTPDSSQRVLTVGVEPLLINPYFDANAQVVELTHQGQAPSNRAHYGQPLASGALLTQQGVTEGTFNLAIVDANLSAGHRQEVFDSIAEGGALAVTGSAPQLSQWVSQASGLGFGLEVDQASNGWLGFRAAGQALTLPDGINRTSSVDRDAISRLATEHLATGTLGSRVQSFSRSHAHDSLTRLHASFVEQTKRGDIDLAELPFPRLNHGSLEPGAIAPGVDALVFVPHPDDETLSFGGAITNLTSKGRTVSLAVLTDGEGGRGGANTEVLRRERQAEVHTASQILGATELDFLNLPDSGKYTDARREDPKSAADVLNDWGVEATLERMVRQIREDRPLTVLSFDASRDANYSQHGAHLASGAAAAIAIQLAKDPAFYPGHAQDGLKPWAVRQHWARVPEHTNVDLHPLGAEGMIRLEQEVNTQKAALQAYDSQVYSIAARESAADTELWSLVQGEREPEQTSLVTERQRADRPVDKSIAVLPVKPAFKGVAAAYFNDPQSVSALYDVSSLTAKADAIGNRIYPRTSLGQILRDQNRAWGNDSALVQANISLLSSDPRSVAVVTGQQVGLGGGPLYSLYKALSTVSLAHELNERGVPAVPIFWLASYDHDLPEVSRLSFFGDQHTPKTIKTNERPNGGAVGALPIGAEGAQALSKLIEFYGAKIKPETAAILKAAISPEQSYTESIARLFAGLLRETGLVMLDPGVREFAGLNRGLVEKELFGASTQAPIAEANQTLLGLGFEPQVATPEDSALGIFFTDDAGNRVSLTRQADGSLATGGTPSVLTADQARALLKAAPERFTPSALLRPVFEDNVIPTVAYVGGPSEVAYYAQTKGVYAWGDVPMPVVARRASFAITTDEVVSQTVARAGLNPLEVAVSADNRNAFAMSALPASVRAVYADLEAFAAKNREWYFNGGKPAEPAELMTRLEQWHREGKAALDATTLEVGRHVAATPELERASSGLAAAHKQWDQHFGKLLTDLRAFAALPPEARKGKTFALKPLGLALDGLKGPTDQLPKVARSMSASTLIELSTLSTNDVPQERVMSVFEAVARYGPTWVNEAADHAQPWLPGTATEGDE